MSGVRCKRMRARGEGWTVSHGFGVRFARSYLHSRRGALRLGPPVAASKDRKQGGERGKDGGDFEGLVGAGEGRTTSTRDEHVGGKRERAGGGSERRTAEAASSSSCAPCTGHAHHAMATLSRIGSSDRPKPDKTTRFGRRKTSTLAGLAPYPGLGQGGVLKSRSSREGVPGVLEVGGCWEGS